MGKIKKAATPKHEATISPALSEFASKAASVPLIELPSHLESFPRRWDFPRGDLYHWILPLNRFDEILGNFVALYGLADGPQTRKFGNDQLLQDTQGADAEVRLQELGFGDDGDRRLVESLLDFSRVLLEKCGNRSLYNSGERLNALLNTTHLSLLQVTLRLALRLAQRYHARHRPTHFHSESLSLHYGLDLDRLQYLAAPVPKPHMAKTSVPSSPVKTSKGKEKRAQDHPLINPNDLLSLSSSSPSANGKFDPGSDRVYSDREDWQEWARVQVSFLRDLPGNATVQGPEQREQDESPTSGSLQHKSMRQGSKLRRMSTSDEPANGVVPDSVGQDKITSSPQTFEPSLAMLSSSSIEEILELHLSPVPKSSRYELLHKLRVAYAILGSLQSHRELLAIRILAVSNLAYVSNDSTFQQRFLAHDREEPKRQQFVYQLANLLHSGGSRELPPVPMQLRIHAINALRALSKQKTVILDISTALSISTSHGILLFVVQEALQDLGQDSDDTDNPEGDEWRESLLSLLHALLLSSPPPTRSGEAFVSSQLVMSYVNVLNLRTQKAQRVYVEVLHFFNAFFHHVKDGLPMLSNHKTFEAAVDLLDWQTRQALECTALNAGFPAKFRTPWIDYQVPYAHQQTIRSILPFLHGVITQQGAQSDRILRNLIDSQALLSAFRLIIENGSLFGGHVWSEVVKTMATFLNNEPTSYTILAEADLIKSFLESIVLRSLGPQANSEQSVPSQDSSNGTSTSQADGRNSPMNVDDQSADVDPKAEEMSCIPTPDPQGILPAAEAMANVSQAFSAICLTTAGSAFFQASGAVEKFFEIFESPAHIKVMKDASFLQILGNSFDELVRHHPTLKSAVISAVVVMVSRIRHLCKSKAWEIGAGAKLWLEDAEGNLLVAGGSRALTREVLSGLHDFDRADDDDPVYLQLPNGKRLLTGKRITSDPNLLNEPVPDETDQAGLTVSDYLTPVTSFLIGLFENPSLCTAFMEVGGTELVLDLATLQSLPDDFSRPSHYGGISHDLAQVVHMMAETKPHLVIPALLDRVIILSQKLETFALSQPDDSTGYVDPLIIASQDSLDSSAESLRENGTEFVKSLTTIQLLIDILSEVFSSSMYHTRNREQPTPFTQVNLADAYVEVCQRLGALSAACHRESKSLERKLPKTWTDATGSNDVSRGSDDGQGNHRNVEDAHRLFRPESAISTSEVPNGLEAGASSAGLDLHSDEKTASSKNTKIVWALLFQLPLSITQLFRELGRGLVGRKRLDAYQKQNAFLVGDAIAGALIHQLSPPVGKDLASPSTETQSSDVWFPYFVEVLKGCTNVLFDFGTSPDHAHLLTVIGLPFRAQGGVNVLKRLGERFYQELKSCRVSSDTIKAMTAANGGLKSITSLLDHLTSAKCVVESSQSTALRSTDPSKPHHFIPAQFLLELRLETLPFVREIWDSDYAEQASRVVLEKLITILRHILSGDLEHEAYKNQDKVPILTKSSPKKFVHNSEKLNVLTSKGFEAGLAKEALFRCNNQSTAAEEYCKAYTRNPKLNRRPIPPAEVESPVPVASQISVPEENTSPDGENPEQANPESHLPSALGELGGGQSLLDLLGNLSQSELAELGTADFRTPLGLQPSFTPDGDRDDGTDPMQNVQNTAEEREAVQPEASSSSPTPAANKRKQDIAETPSEVKSAATVEKMNVEREQIRADLAERCLNIINNHYDITWELSELLKSATKRLDSQDAADFRETACTLLVTSLVSFQSDLEADDVCDATRKKIAAYAHFVALLMQDKDLYDECLPHLQGSFETLLRFLQIPSSEIHADASLPWIAQILLIVERMLSDDAEPRQVLWNIPTSIDGPLPDAATFVDKTIVTREEKVLLFESLLEVLPRVGKDESLALSITRVLAILTRERPIAVQLSEKRNLQRLFVMMKQLANHANDRVHSSFMLTLRHVIEDDATLRQIMASEIVANFDTRNSRQIDTTTYVRNLYHLVLRSPEIFVQVTNEKLKLQRFDATQRPQTLILKSEQPASEGGEAPPEQPKPSSSTSAGEDTVPETKDSVETARLDPVSEDAKVKTTEVKPPVVEHPDGVIHFLLYQLLSYKDVEDKDGILPLTERPAASPTDAANEVDMDEASSSLSSPQPEAHKAEKVEKPSFRGDDHPIFIYRCFLLQCLTELLHSYNRTKIEFIGFSRKSDPLAVTPSKPRSGVLNYLLNTLIPLDTVEVEESIQFKKRSVTSEWATKVVIALCSKTGEQGVVMGRDRYLNSLRVEDNDDEPSLTFVRRFTLEHSLKAFKDANFSTEEMQTRYARLLCLAHLLHQMLSKPTSNDGGAGSNSTSHKVLAKMMFEKNCISVLTSSLADIDLTFAGAKRVVKYILKPLNELTDTAVYLSLNSSTPISSALRQSEEGDISSASSVTEADDEREETPDLFRNSALGMLDPSQQSESSSESEPEEEDDDMDEGAFADDMDFEEDVTPVSGNDGEVVSDEDVDDGAGPGPMEGLSGDVPLNYELILDDVRMDLDYGDSEDGVDDEDDDDDDGEEEDDDDDDDDEEEEDEDEGDEEDLLADADDISGGGEINGDNENESLADDDGDWQSVDDPETAADEEDSHDGLEEILNRSSTSERNVNNGNNLRVEQAPLNNLLNILGENAHASRPSGEEIGELLDEGEMEHVMQELQEDEDEDDDEDELDENEDDLAFRNNFNDMLDDVPPLPWGAGGVPAFQRTRHRTPTHHHHHFRAAPGQYTSFMSRHITGHGMPMPTIHRSHRVPPPARQADDGTNPLLQQPGSSNSPGPHQGPSAMDLFHGFGPGLIGYLPTGPVP